MNKRLLQDVVSKEPGRATGRPVYRSGDPQQNTTLATHTQQPGTKIPPRRIPSEPQQHPHDSEEFMSHGVETRNEKPGEFHTPQPLRRPPPPPLGAKRTTSGGKSSWFVVAGIIGIVVLALAFLLSTMFSGATVTVYPKQQQNVFVDGTFTAKQEPLPGELGYNIMTIERTVSEEVEAQSGESVEEFASGEIIVFNEFDENPQRLIKNTRFESPEGNIYRIRDSVVVPGMSVGQSGQDVPGQIEVTVYADEPGDGYNLDETQFTIPGFEGTDRFDGFYARSKTPITGGFVGTKLSLPEDEEKAIRERLQEQLIAELEKAAFSSSEKPEGFYLFEGAVITEFESLSSNEIDSDTVEIREKGVLQALLFNEQAFASHLADSVVAGYDDVPIRLQNPEDLAITVTKVESDTLPWDGSTYRVKITGAANFIWEYDEEQLRQDLLGREDEALPTILSAYPGIERAEVIVRPFWRSTFPEEAEEIAINQVLD